MMSGNLSKPAVLNYGVPQGSVLGPGFFTDYSSPAASFVRKHGISVHCYADDTQLYASFNLEDEALMLERLETCVRDLRVWMNRNRLKLNDSKTKFIIFGTSRFLKCVRTTSILVGESNIAASKEVRNIGAMFDCHMKMNAQVRTICRGAWLNLYNISKVRSYLNDDQTRCVVHAYVISKLDANNSLLAGSPSLLVSQIERVQNAAAKLVTKSKKFDHVSPILRNLHWLPIQDRIVFKNLLLIYKALNNKGPTYLKDLFTFHRPSLALRSKSDPLALNVPMTKLKTYGDRAFSAYAAKQWNKLPLAIRQAETISSFKSALKTYLFTKNGN